MALTVFKFFSEFVNSSEQLTSEKYNVPQKQTLNGISNLI